MKKIPVILGIFLIALSNASMARVWRVNNDPTKDPDFATITDAVTAATEGDTIHVEPSHTAYGFFTLTRRLVILGNGYFLGASGLQADIDSSVVSGVGIDSSSVTANASGAFIAGISFGTISLLHNVRNITITRCRSNSQIAFNSFDRPSEGLVFTKCFVDGFVTESAVTALLNITFENNIFSAATGIGGIGFSLGVNEGGLFRNNIFNSTSSVITLSNFYISNNVFTAATSNVVGSNNVIRNNSFAAASVTNVTNGADGNQVNVSMPGLFVGSLSAGYGDTRFQTNPGSLRGSGETISGITPDRGAYNTVTATDTYRSSGIPAIPTIYVLTVPTSISPTATSMNITVSTRSNN